MSKKWVVWIVFMGILLILSLQDYKKKEVSLFVIGAGVLLGIFLRGVSIELLLKICPGILLFVFSILSEEKMGLGDSLVIGMGAFFLSLESLLIWIFLAFLLAGIIGIILMMFFHKNKKEQIPFVPFLWVSAIFTCLLQYMENYENYM